MPTWLTNSWLSAPGTVTAEALVMDVDKQTREDGG